MRNPGLGVFLCSIAMAVGCTSHTPPATNGVKTGADRVATGEQDAKLPADPAAPLPLGPKVRTGVLPNGLRYFIRENQKPSGRAEFRLAVDAGSFQEDDDQRGLAHFLEHMAFNGTKSFPKNELIKRLQELGVRFGPHINARTSFDETVYMLGVPTDKPTSLTLTLQILREWAGDITLLPEDVEAERGVVLSEKRDSLGAEMRVMETTISKVFSGMRYADRLPIGLPEILKTAKPETLARFYRDWYRPDNMALIAVGDFDAAAIEQEIKSTFGSLPKAEEPARPDPDRTLPQRTEPMFLALQDVGMPISAVLMGRLLPARKRSSMNDFRREYIESMTVGMLNQRIGEARQKNGARFLGGGIGAIPFVRGADGIGLLAAVKPGGMKEGLDDLLAEAERARRYGFTKGEIRRMNDQIIAAMANSAKEAAAGREDSATLAEELVRVYLTDEGAPGRDVELQLMQHFAKTVEPAAFQEPLATLLSASDLVIATIAPAGAKVVSRDEALGLLAALPQKQLVAYADTPSSRKLMDKQPTPGKVTAESHDAALGITEWTLSNGARVLLKPTTFKADQILFAASSKGGTSLIPTESWAKTRLAADVVGLGGLGELDAIELQKALAGRDVSMTPFIDPLEEGVWASSSVADVEIMLQLVHLAFTAPRLDQKAFHVWRDSIVTSTNLAMNKPEVRFEYKYHPVLTNKNPRQTLLTAEDYKELDLEASLAFYRERLTDADDFTFFVVGSFEPAKLKPLVERYIGSLPRLPREESFTLHPRQVHNKKTRFQLRDGQDARARLRFSFQRDLGNQVVTPKERVAFEMFAEAVNLELLDLLREKMGDTYSVWVRPSYSGRYRYAHLDFGFNCDPKRAAALEKIALAEIRRLVGGKGVDSEYLERSRKASLAALDTALEDNNDWLHQMKNMVFDGRPLPSILAQKDIVRSTTAKEVARVAKRLVNPKSPVIGVHLPDKK